jgi:glycosyltransferase involved in cell wall biosynthesis
MRDLERAIVVSHPGVGPHVQLAARALDEAGLLKYLVTSYAYRPQDLVTKAITRTLKPIRPTLTAELKRRTVTEIPDTRVVTHPAGELIRLTSVKLGFGPVISDRVWEIAERSFDALVARKHLSGAAVIYGYEHASLRSFQVMKRQGGRCVLEMATCHHSAVSRLVTPELDRFPELWTPYERHLISQAPRRDRRKDEELGLADLIICNSTFAKESLVGAGLNEDKIGVVPFGFPPVPQPRAYQSRKKFRFLVVGHVSVRKGAHNLLEAWRRLSPQSDAELVFVGSMQLPRSLAARLPDGVIHQPPVPHGSLNALYDSADALVFSALAEGFGLVIVEAMARGLPVIGSTNSGARDVIRHGHNGFLIDPRSVDDLVATMRWCLSHRAELAALGSAAQGTARSWQLENYRAAVASAVVQSLRDYPTPDPITTPAVDQSLTSV